MQDLLLIIIIFLLLCLIFKREKNLKSYFEIESEPNKNYSIYYYPYYLWSYWSNRSNYMRGNFPNKYNYKYNQKQSYSGKGGRHVGSVSSHLSGRRK